MSDLVRVAIVQTQPEADVALGLLQSEGIAAIWEHTDYAPAGFPLGSAGGITGPFDVLVQAEDEARAREVLAPV